MSKTIDNSYIDELRSQMDLLDNEIIAIISKRHSLAKIIGNYKISNNLPIIDKKRESEARIYHKKLTTQYGISYNYISELYQLIIEQSREIQLKLIDK